MLGGHSVLQTPALVSSIHCPHAIWQSFNSVYKIIIDLVYTNLF